MPNPDARQIAEVTLMAAEKLKIFGMRPKVALLSHSAFGSEEDRVAAKMKRGPRDYCGSRRRNWKSKAK